MEQEKKFSQYAKILDRRIFEPGGRIFSSNETMALYLRQLQLWFNDKLRLNKVVTLKEIYDELEIESEPWAKTVGWRFIVPNSKGDNYIDFGIYYPCNREFFNGDGTKIVLDFNVDGVLY